MLPALLTIAGTLVVGLVAAAVAFGKLLGTVQAIGDTLEQNRDEMRTLVAQLWERLNWLERRSAGSTDPAPARPVRR